ncbi:tetratricopeptide repeat protein [Phormidium yuhuli AB48]|uniref:Probable UDP-N-acetylglucosamine--peptide N-acetylglucosaminyltransferase SPINDLY n=1 Tax=Phormidium yuhuli AB48 TaxID=2940671 RepID=A0ABY5AQT0_9CYAN|nr:tetratricopeptide repeat protein [Phormidium yuhuli]USR90716.1 tetratricopeptide repeat protein [Phormidium yuhuli AB48]
MSVSVATAIASHQTGEVERAEELYRQILAENPQEAAALHGLGMIAYQQQQYERAIEQIEQAIALDQSHAAYHNTLGMAYRAQGHLDKSLAAYRQGLLLDPDSNALQGNFTRAWLEYVDRDRPAALNHLVQLGRAYHRLGNFSQAKQLYGRVLEYDADQADALQGLGTLAYQHQDHSQAVTLLQRAIALNPNAASYHHNLGAVYQAQGQLAAATAAYRRAVELNANLEAPRKQLNQLLEHLRQKDVETWKQEMFKLAQCFQEQENYRQAVFLYQKILEVDSQSAAAHYHLGRIAYHHHQSYQAMVDLEKAVKLDPNNAEYHHGFGLACLQHSVPQMALEQFKKALELDPENQEYQQQFNETIEYFLHYYHECAQWHYNLEEYQEAATIDFQAGNFVKEHTGRLQTAQRYYRQSLDLCPNYAEVHLTLAEIYLEEKNFSQALLCARKAIQGKPDSAEAYKALGNAFLGQKNGNAAMNAYQRAIAIKPDFAEVYSNVASIYFFQNQNHEALQLYQKALSYNQELPGIHWNLGKVYERMGKVDETIQCWQRALELDPNFGGGISYQHLAGKYYAKGQKEEAVKLFHKAIELQPDLTESYWALCEVYNTKNQAAARAVSLKFCENVTGKDRIMALLAAMKAHLNSGVSEVAIAKFNEVEPLIYNAIQQYPLTYNEVVRLYLNLAFDMPHVRDDVAKNAKLSKTLAQLYLKYLEAKANSEKHAEIPIRPRPNPGHPLRIGFLSKHFRRHSVGWLSVDIIEALSQITPHIFLYVTGDMGRDELTERFENAAEKFSRPEGAQAKLILQEIAQDNLDVLIDMDSVTVMPNTEVFYSSPAHVCLTWLGFDAPYITPKNYYLGDWQTHPAGVEEHYIEQIVRLPDSFAATAGLPIRQVDREVLRRSMRVAPNQVAFLCVATGNKFCPELVEAQIKILAQVPDSLLFYKGRVGDLLAIEEIYQNECRRQGVRTNRIRVLPRTQTEEEHRLIYQFADVLIDSYPYSGATHVVEALWFNMPVVALVSQQSFGRQAYSLMKAAGSDLGVAWTWQEYIDWGVRMGRDEGLRQQMRSQLEQGKQPDSLAPLWNPRKFAADMYNIFKDLVAQRAAG